MKAIPTLIAAALLAAAGVQAQQAPQAGAAAAAPAARAGSSAPESDGEVRKINLDQGKVTLRHGPLANLDMPPMTMVFTVADKKLLEGLKEGDKVRFRADRQNGVYVVTAIAAAK